MRDLLGPPALNLAPGHDLWFTTLGAGERIGYIQVHPRPDGAGECHAGGLFDLPAARKAFPDRPVWQVESWDPLTLSPSLLCRECGNHGFVREGRWVSA